MSVPVTDAAVELANSMTRLLLEHIDDPVRQQQAIEIVMAAHASRMDTPVKANFVVDSMAKHARQLLAILKG
jgi:hypothetical protein